MAKKPASPDDVMTIAELKPLLRLVKGEAEIGCCVALTEAREALILVSKKGKPRAVRTGLLKKAKEAGLEVNTQSVRFGRASTAPDDESVLLIKINKGPTEGPLPLAVKKRTKLAGFKDVIFSVDETLDTESDDETEDADPAPSAPPAPPPAPPLAPQENQAGPSADQLRAAMEKLAPRIKAAMAASADLRQPLATATKSFMALLNAADLPGARHGLEDLVRLLKQAATPTSPAQTGPAQTGPAQGGFKQAHDAWLEAIGSVDQQLDALAQTLKRETDSELADIAEFGLNAVTANHKVPLMAALLELGPGTPETIAKSGPKALAAIQAFRTHVDTDERIEACDDNPFGVPVSIRTTLAPALTALEAALSPK